MTVLVALLCINVRAVPHIIPDCNYKFQLRYAVLKLLTHLSDFGGMRISHSAGDLKKTKTLYYNFFYVK